MTVHFSKRYFRELFDLEFRILEKVQFRILIGRQNKIREIRKALNRRKSTLRRNFFYVPFNHFKHPTLK